MNLNLFSDRTHLLFAPATAWLKKAWGVSCLPVPTEYPVRLWLKCFKISDKTKKVNLDRNKILPCSEVKYETISCFNLTATLSYENKTHWAKWWQLWGFHLLQYCGETFLKMTIGSPLMALKPHYNINIMLECSETVVRSHLQDKPLYWRRTSRMLLGLDAIPFPAWQVKKDSVVVARIFSVCYSDDLPQIWCTMLYDVYHSLCRRLFHNTPVSISLTKLSDTVLTWALNVCQGLTGLLLNNLLFILSINLINSCIKKKSNLTNCSN